MKNLFAPNRSKSTPPAAFRTAAACVLLALALPAWSQERPAPVPVQVQLFLKILSFDRSLEANAGREIVIGVVYQSSSPPSLAAEEAWCSAIAGDSLCSIKGIPVRCVPIDLISEASLGDSVSAHGIDVLYLAPLRGADVSQILQTACIHRLVTLTGEPALVPEGVAVGVGVRGDRPQITINLPAARTQGADFTSQLLKLSRVIE